MIVDIVIVSFNTQALLRQCLQSIAEHTDGIDVRTVVVDNASGDGSADMVEQEFPAVKCIRLEENLGFGAANNRGMEAVSASYVLFLNSDAELTPWALGALLHHLEENAECVIAGPRLLNPGGSFQPSCRRFPNFWRNLWCYSGLAARFPYSFRNQQTWLAEEEHQMETQVDMVSGASFLARRSYMESIGGFDENLFLFEEEMDISIPAKRQGREVQYCPGSEVIHHGGASVEESGMSAFASRHLFRSKYYAFRKHYGPEVARLTYMADRTLFGLSALLNRIRRTSSDAAALRATGRRAWKESFVPMDDLRKRTDFYED